MSVLDDFNAEMDFNVGSAEFAQTFAIIYGGQRTDVDGIVSYAWKRKETDGRLDPGSPMSIPSVVVPIGVLRSMGITEGLYESLKVEDAGVEYGVISYENTNPVRLFLKSDSGSEPEPEPDENEPVPEPEPEPIPEPEPEPEPVPDY